jgi:hypothetical protein
VAVLVNSLGFLHTQVDTTSNRATGVLPGGFSGLFSLDSTLLLGWMLGHEAIWRSRRMYKLHDRLPRTVSSSPVFTLQPMRVSRQRTLLWSERTMHQCLCLARGEGTTKIHP